MSKFVDLKKSFFIFVAILVLLSFGDTAQARRRHKKKRPKKVSVTLLMRLGDPAPEHWSADLTSAAKAAAAEQKKLRWQDPPQVSLDETRTLLGCAAWDANCIAQIGGTLGVQKVIYLDLRGQTLRIFNIKVKQPNKAHKVSLRLPDRRVMGLTLAQAYVRAAVLQQKMTSLVVTSSPDRAEVSLDGQVIGHTPLMQMSHVAAGQHQLQIKLDGYKVLQKSISAKTNQITLVQVSLQKAPPVLAASTKKARPSAAPQTKPEASKVHSVTAKQIDAGRQTAAQDQTSADSAEAGGDLLAMTSLGLGGAMLLGAGVVGTLHLVNFMTIEDSLYENRTASRLTQEEYTKRSQLLWPMYGGSIALAGLGLASTGIGSWLFLSDGETAVETTTP